MVWQKSSSYNQRSRIETHPLMHASFRRDVLKVQTVKKLLSLDVERRLPKDVEGWSECSSRCVRRSILKSTPGCSFDRWIGVLTQHYDPDIRRFYLLKRQTNMGAFRCIGVAGSQAYACGWSQLRRVRQPASIRNP